MLLLFESPHGYSLLKIKNSAKLLKSDDIYASVLENKSQIKLQAFNKFTDPSEALASLTKISQGNVPKNLQKFIEAEIRQPSESSLGVQDVHLGAKLKKKMNLQIVHNSKILELARAVRANFPTIVPDYDRHETHQLNLNIAHHMSRARLQFSAEKIDMMIIQSVALLDDLGKELNGFSMRIQEWYGWHFPELAKVVEDNLLYVRTIRLIGLKENASTATGLSELLPNGLDKAVVSAAEMSMGSEITTSDLDSIILFCDEFLRLTEYRETLTEYVQNRMIAIAPNLSQVVGDLVGARLMSHAGSLMSLAKAPASTIQLLGAENAFFRALKSKHALPKYGLIFHSALISKSQPQMKGKIARTLAAKAALAVRVDAFSTKDMSGIGALHRAKVEEHLRHMETRQDRMQTWKNNFKSGKKLDFVKTKNYDPSNDIRLVTVSKTDTKKEPEPKVGSLSGLFSQVPEQVETQVKPVKKRDNLSSTKEHKKRNKAIEQ